MPAVFAHPPFLALCDGQDAKLLESTARIAPFLVESNLLETSSSTPSFLPAGAEYWVNLAQGQTEEQAISILDNGASRIVTKDSALLDGAIPSERILLRVDSTTSTLVSDKKTVDNVAGLVVDLPEVQAVELLSSFREALGGKASRDGKLLFFVPSSSTSIDDAIILAKADAKATPCLPLSRLDTSSIGTLFTSVVKTDRTDGLFATLVSSTSGDPLGLVYSSTASLAMSIASGDATYYSRSRNSLWKKGETSGATQKVGRIRLDCDADAIEFEVDQKQGTGFCHTLRSSSCFGPASGLPALEETIRSRIDSAPKDSYTARLLSDPKMLNAKIREEADELCRAESKDEIASEAADLLYFALVRCLASGVSLADVGAVLDKRAGKVTRRPGHAKPAFVQAEASSASQTNGHATTNGFAAAQDRQEAMVKGVEATTKPIPAAVSAGIVKPEPSSLSNGSTKDDTIVPLKFSLQGIDKKGRDALLQRPLASSQDMIGRVQPIVDAVRTQGDQALRSYIKNFDRCAQIDDPKWSHVLTAPFAPELMAISDETKRNIDRAFENIRAFHQAQMDKEVPMVVETMPGVVCTRFIQPIDRVGLYVPGGTAVLPSTALMLSIPAQIAGCRFISLATPAGSDGNVRPEIVYIANKCGVKQIVKAGGAQAVASMAYGTETVGKVDKIFGPGNQWVTAAKMAVSMDSLAGVGIDMPAGPSEVLVIADKTANPIYVASDLLSQAEHGPDSQVVLLAVDLAEDHLAAIEAEIDAQAKALPRVDIVRIAIAKSLIVRCADLQEAMAFSNDYAPEHLILHLEDAPGCVKLVRNAGSVFVGAFSPESCGDYASGTNHTLPTAGYARQFSGVSTLSFTKHITSQQLSEEGLKKLGPVVEHLAELEGLHAHKNAVTVRLQGMAAAAAAAAKA